MTRKIIRDGQTAEEIAAALCAEIIAGKHPPETMLFQEELAERFQTSRMPIRESLKILEREGLVLLPANRSAVVAPLDVKSFVEINEMRAVAEPLALRHAIPELTNRLIAQAEAIQDDAEQSDIAEFAALNRAFHMTLLGPCARPRLLSHIASLTHLSQRYFHTVAVELEYSASSHKEHRALLAACAARDAACACAILQDHIEAASRLMEDALRAKGAAPSSARMEGSSQSAR
ncbi:GntR family transcriptional regulator [Roseobacter sp.]|uniref:GntR family transcriptional regulator n=1 Tax=Roseobacter sp. TaxID=1907202 RepID=UPI00296654DA|nr:GntR family transcriptional regulator [Roseobacter sp.]MDW3181398.1 GntR family transcriptional regulator [Roseobacter sp.]